MCQITCFLCLKNYSKALKESDSVLKAKLEINEMIGVLFVNALSKYQLSQFVPALSSFRELCKLSKSLKSTNKLLLHMHLFPFTSSALIKIGRKEQGLQLAIEGLNCAEMLGANSWFYENFAKIIRDNTAHIKRDTNNYVSALSMFYSITPVEQSALETRIQFSHH